MHINLKAKSCNGTCMTTKFKVDTGADGNLLPLTEFFKHFPNAIMNQLAKTRDPSTALYAYNNTEIKQSGMCELKLEYRDHCKICQFYVIDFPTAILGISDSENLKLVTIHFNSVDTEISQKPEANKPLDVIQRKKDADEFSIKIHCEYKDLFTGIGNMNTTIDIKLKDGAIPYVAPICRVAHALQEPLRLELEAQDR